MKLKVIAVYDEKIRCSIDNVCSDAYVEGFNGDFKVGDVIDINEFNITGKSDSVADEEGSISIEKTTT